MTTSALRRAAITTEIGTLTLEATDTTLVGLRLPDPGASVARGRRSDDRATLSTFLAEVARQIDEYLAGERTTFDVPIDLRGTEFQQQVWAALGEIPYGTTATYGAVADRIGRPGAARAVGLANNRNPIAIIVPCHRVIGAGGKLVGYGGGIELKTRLLVLEGSLAA
jgi:methylated-DNA-[protein]-cysteine S-methyltransferase